MTLGFDETQSQKLPALLGLPPATDDQQLILDTIQDLTRAEPDADDAPCIATAAKKHGAEPLDADTRAALERAAADGRRPIVAARKADVESKVDKAIDRGAIAPSRRVHWIALLDNDPGMHEVLASIGDGTAVPLTEIGHSGAESDTHLTPEREPHWFY
ncbi:hypothetical protein A5656_27995 [Mycobacterium gordonae]|nr:hypothetical protein A5656_27995 [Mycobacterium gordonae]